MPSSYQLKISLTSPQLEGLNHANSYIAVAKPSEGGNPTVVWQSIRPNKAISMTWEEQYGIYASESRVSAGATIDSVSSTDGMAVKGKGYRLLPSGVFVGPEGELSPNSYHAKNLYSEPNQSLIMGLYQPAEVGSTLIPGNPVSYAPVGRGAEAIMTPYTTLYVWTQSEVKSKTFLTEVVSAKTKVVFGGSVTSVELEYESEEGIFVVKGGKTQAGLTVETFVPVTN